MGISRRAALAAFTLFASAASAQQVKLPIERIAGAPYPFAMTAAPQGGAVAWVYNERGARNIWVAEPSGGSFTSKRLTDYTEDDGIDMSETGFTGDARWVIYTRGGDSGGRVAVNPTSAVDGPKAGAVWAVPVAGGAAKKIADGTSASPSPKGDLVVFLKSGQPMVVNVGGSEAPAPLFVDRGLVGTLRWSPDGSKLAFVSTRPNHSMVGLYDFATKTISWMAPSIDKDSRPVWSPDGKKIAFVRNQTSVGAGPRPQQGRNREGTPWELWTVEVATGPGKPIFKAKTGQGSVFRDLFNSADSLFWGAGDKIIFPSEVTGWVRLYSIAAGGGEPVLITPGESEVFAGQVSPDRSRVVFATNQGDIDRRHLWEVFFSGGAPKQISTGEGIEDYPVINSEDRVFAVHGEPRLPLKPVMAASKGLTDLAPQALPKDFPSDQLPDTHLVTYQSPDGLTVHGTLFVPKGLKGKAPALVFSHGGPTNRQTFDAWDSFETHSHLYEANLFLASQGYVVLSINYRGGSGYGLNFREAENFGTNGGSELNDLIGAAKFLQSRPEVDPKKLGIWGGSYGGRMTSLAMAKAPDYWVAGVDYAGVHDMSLYYLAGDTVDPAARKLALDSSAMGHVDTWKAPVLLMVGDADALEPQTEMLAAALRARNIPVETMMLPDEVHFMLRHQSWNKVFQATKDYLDRFLMK